MAITPNKEQCSTDPCFVWGGVGWGDPKDTSGPPSFIPSDEELRQQREVADARKRYSEEHPEENHAGIGSTG